MAEIKTESGCSMGAEKKVARWGGIAGILIPIFFILMAVTSFVFIPPAPDDPEGLVMRFKENRSTIATAEGFYLVVVILLITLFISLYRVLRKASVAPALIGTGIGLVGLAVLAAGALPYVAFTHISDLDSAPGTTTESNTTIALMYQSIQGVFHETDTVGFILMALGFILLGASMFGSPDFGKRYGWAGLVFGGIALAGMAIFGITSKLVFIFILPAFIVLPLIYGWKLYSLSRVFKKDLI
jgi:hypothetical protein